MLEALAALPREQRIEAIALLEEVQRRRSRRLFFALYPDRDTPWNGPSNKEFKPGAIIYARDKYQKHLEFFRAGATYRERCFMAANRVSKTLGGGGYEIACHLTGLYPIWWEGRRFGHAIEAWAAGKKNETTRDIVQATLLGRVRKIGPRKIVTGTGVIPGDLLDVGAMTWKQGVADMVDTIPVKHVSGEWSYLGIKSYEQGRGSFEGTGKHVIWEDEEPPADVHDECLLRTATTDGLLMLTFTPLEGMSTVVLGFMPAEMRPDAS